MGVTLSHPIFLATEPLSFGKIDEMKNKLPLPRYIREKGDSHQDHVQTTYCVCNCRCQWYETENF